MNDEKVSSSGGESLSWMYTSAFFSARVTFIPYFETASNWDIQGLNYAGVGCDIPPINSYLSFLSPLAGWDFANSKFTLPKLICFSFFLQPSWWCSPGDSSASQHSPRRFLQCAVTFNCRFFPDSRFAIFYLGTRFVREATSNTWSSLQLHDGCRRFSFTHVTILDYEQIIPSSQVTTLQNLCRKLLFLAAWTLSKPRGLSGTKKEVIKGVSR